MYLKKIFILIAFSLIFTGCMNKDKDPTFNPTGNQSLEITKLSTKGVTDQQPADQAKEFLSNYEEVSSVRAVNHDNNLLIAVEIEHDERFALDNMERQLRKEIKRNFANMKVTLSTDQKLLIELEQLENDIELRNISKKELKKRINELIKLSKEQT